MLTKCTYESEKQSYENGRVKSLNKKESLKIPETFPVAGLYDETGGIHFEAIEKLLVKERLAFVEVKYPLPKKFNTHEIKHINLEKVPDNTSVIRFEIGDKNSPYCYKDEKNRPFTSSFPFKPNACLLVKPQQKPEAKYAIDTQVIQTWWSDFPRWVFKETQTGEVLFASVDKPVYLQYGPYYDNRYTDRKKDWFLENTPYNYLVDTLVSDGSNDASLQKYRLDEKNVTLSAYSNKIDEIRSILPSIKTVSLNVDFDTVDPSLRKEIHQVEREKYNKEIYEKAQAHGVWMNSSISVIDATNNLMIYYTEKINKEKYRYNTSILNQAVGGTIGTQLILLSDMQDIQNMFLLGYDLEGNLQWLCRLNIQNIAEVPEGKFDPISIDMTDRYWIIYGDKRQNGDHILSAILIPLDQLRVIGKN